MGKHDDEPWGPANITLTNAQAVLGLLPVEMQPGSALGIVDALQTMSGAIMFAAAIMKDNQQYVRSDSPPRQVHVSLDLAQPRRQATQPLRPSREKTLDQIPKGDLPP